jgi:hypothetical protein
MNLAVRTIHTRACPYQVPDLLQNLFAAELIQPSDQLWIVSPWISDIPILDNTEYAFRALHPEWPRGKVLLSRLLERFSDLGTRVHLVTRDLRTNQSFLNRFKQLKGFRSAQLILYTDDMNHSKGILGRSFYLSGSMNFTNSGISANDETVHLNVDGETLAKSRIEFASRWNRRVNL